MGLPTAVEQLLAEVELCSYGSDELSVMQDQARDVAVVLIGVSGPFSRVTIPPQETVAPIYCAIPLIAHSSDTNSKSGRSNNQCIIN